MTSPLVARLVAEINRCTDREARAVLFAELGCYRARAGDFDEAERLRRELRAEFGDGHSIRVSILVMCLESHLLYYRELSPDARDRMARASLLSRAAGDRRLVALTSAWMAHHDFSINAYEAAFDNLRQCFEAIDADDGNAECRASLMLGDIFLFIGNPNASRNWYESARRAAVRIGDQATIGAITYNRAALLVAAARLASLSRRVTDDDKARARAEVESAINYQAVAQLRSLDHLLRTAKIGVLMLHAKYPEALAAIRLVLASSAVPAGSAQSVLLEADRIRALAETGDMTEAAQGMDRFSTEILPRFASDDRALILSSIERAASLCGDHQLSAGCAERVKTALMEHAREVEDLRCRLADYEHRQCLGRVTHS